MLFPLPKASRWWTSLIPWTTLPKIQLRSCHHSSNSLVWLCHSSVLLWTVHSTRWWSEQRAVRLDCLTYPSASITYPDTAWVHRLENSGDSQAEAPWGAGPWRDIASSCDSRGRPSPKEHHAFLVEKIQNQHCTQALLNGLMQFC